MHFTLSKIQPEGVGATNGLDDIILPLRYALARLGFAVETRVNSLNPASVNIVFGTCQAVEITEYLPANSIVFNLEQLAGRQSPWRNRNYLDHLAQFSVWDYSRRNVDYLRGLGFSADLVRLGYVPEMTRLARRTDTPRDTDVLFYGLLNERRKHVLDEAGKAGLRTDILYGVYGAERDRAITRCRCALNVHFYTPASLEIARLGYLWANRIAVVSELRDDTEMDSGLENACRYCAYDDLVQGVCEMARSGTAREHQARTGFAAFAALRQEDFLEKVVGRRIYAAQTQGVDGDGLERPEEWAVR